MASSKLSLSFRVFKGDQLVAEHTLTQGVIKIGKVPSAHLRIDDESISRMHAIIEVSGEEASIIDLGSTRGTIINGKRINKAKLATGDVITLGEMRVEVAIAAVATAAVVVAPLPVPAPMPVAGPAPAYPLTFTAPPPPPAPKPAPPIPVALPLQTTPSPTMFQQAMADANDDHGAARAVEIAAMLGDSVVNVKHCIDPRAGKVTPATWGFLAGGALCLLASATAFYVSVHTASVNSARRDYWTHVEKKPDHAFRPEMLSPGVDWMAFGGLAFGLVGLTAGLARARREKQSPYFRIGTAPGVEQPVEHAPAPAFPLVAPSGDDFVFNFGAGIDGELIVDGRATPLAELAATGRAHPSASTAGAIEVPIPANAKIRARAGQTTFLVSAVARPRRQATPFFANLESRALTYFAASLAVHLGVWAFLNTIPPEDSGVSVSLNENEMLLGHLENTQQDDTPPPKPEPGEDGDGGGKNDAAAMALPEGQAGDPKIDHDGRMSVAKRDTPPSVSHDQALEQARTAGILGSALLDSTVTVLGSPSNIASGFDVTDQNGQIYGADGGGYGSFGAGRRGEGIGGGCLVEPCGIVGVGGPYRTIGSGVHGGDRFGFPGHGPGLPGHHATLPTVGLPVTSGPGYDRSIIRRYIRRRINEIGYCYEKQLLAKPGIGGEIAATFLITPAGTVQSSKASGFDSEVASCVASVIGSIEFPKPGDGIGVQVNYPFNFHPSGK